MPAYHSSQIATMPSVGNMAFLPLKGKYPPYYYIRNSNFKNLISNFENLNLTFQ